MTTSFGPSATIRPLSSTKRVLAINAEHAPAVANVLAGLEPDRFDLVIAHRRAATFSWTRCADETFAFLAGAGRR